MRDRVVIVTGGAKGIGRHAAHTFAREGARVVIADILPSDKVLSELQSDGAEAIGIRVDVQREDQVKAMAEKVASRFGRIDVLLNNAAVVTHPAWTPLWPRIRDMDKSFWDCVIETNLSGTFLCTKNILPYMEEQRSGHIINTYGGGQLTPFGSCAYVASKQAVRAFTRYVAEEEREFNICIVVTGASGAVATEEAPEEVRQRLPGPESVGDLYVFAAQAGMELSGQLVRLTDGRLQAAP